MFLSDRMGNRPVGKILAKLRPYLVYTIMLVGLYLISLYRYILFHSLVEIFSIVIGITIFIIAWNSRTRLENNYLLFLGISCMYVSALDIVHMLSYKGMGVFSGYDANLPTQLWIAGRYLYSLSWLISPLFFRWRLNVDRMMLVYSLLTAALFGAIFGRVFPVCYVEGVGLTTFKIVSEYVIILILLGAIFLLYRSRQSFDRESYLWLMGSLILNIAAEFAFTSYISVYGPSNLIGHFLRIFASFFVYKAILEVGLNRPHLILYRNLQQSEAALRVALEKVQRLAAIDSLTGLYNRGQFFELAELEVQRARRYQRSVSVIMLDIDHFKVVNDTHGHAAGDQALREVAECCRQEMRSVDLIGRYGGEEFAFLLPECNLYGVVHIAERLRQRIADTVIQTETGPVTLTVSMGVAALQDPPMTLDMLFVQADEALYHAKRNGRNQVQSA